MRIVQNLLELLKTAGETTPLARVVDVAGGGHEGKVNTSDLGAFNISLTRIRPHMISMHTLALESLADQAPNVSFVHDFPGAVYTYLHRGVGGALGWVVYIVLEMMHAVLGRWLFVPIEESGERHVYLATSGRYRPRNGKRTDITQEESQVLAGSNGEIGSGVYSVGWNCEGPAERAVVALKELRANGVKKLVWDHFTTEFDRISGAGGTKPA
jgi:hypothetical protein